MKIKIIAFIGLCVTVLSCSKPQNCGADLELGSHPLTDKSKSYLPYSRNSKSLLVFKNRIGDSLLLKNDSACAVKPWQNRRDSVICTGNFLDEAIAKHNGEFISGTWKGAIGLTTLSYSAKVESIALSVAQKHFSDQIVFKFFLNNNRSTLNYNISHDSLTHPNTISAYEGQGRFIKDTLFNGKIFKNVLVAPNDIFFVAQDKGLIAFKYEGNFWILEAIQ